MNPIAMAAGSSMGLFGVGAGVGGVACAATFSPDRAYRYTLSRHWADGPAFVVIGLNPSTADEQHDDPTIRRCIGFAKREGCGRLAMLNLFALCSTDPAALYTAPDPVGPDNDNAIRRECATEGAVVVAAWGAHGERWPGRVQKVLPLIWHHTVLRCFGVTKAGHPKHPLYLRSDAPLVNLRAEQERVAARFR